MTLDTIMTMTASEADQWFADTDNTSIEEIERILDEVEERKKERGYL